MNSEGEHYLEFQFTDQHLLLIAFIPVVLFWCWWSCVREMRKCNMAQH